MGSNIDAIMAVRSKHLGKWLHPLPQSDRCLAFHQFYLDSNCSGPESTLRSYVSIATKGSHRNVSDKWVMEDCSSYPSSITTMVRFLYSSFSIFFRWRALLTLHFECLYSVWGFRTRNTSGIRVFEWSTSPTYRFAPPPDFFLSACGCFCLGPLLIHRASRRPLIDVGGHGIALTIPVSILRTVSAQPPTGQIGADLKAWESSLAQRPWRAFLSSFSLASFCV